MPDPAQPRDFDEWRILASSDPEGFEVARRKVLAEAIAQAPENRRQRLEAMQWRLDRVRERSATPLAACISMSDLMWQCLAGEHGLLEALRGGNCPYEVSRQRAPVIQLRQVRPGKENDLP